MRSPLLLQLSLLLLLLLLLLSHTTPFTTPHVRVPLKTSSRTQIRTQIRTQRVPNRVPNRVTFSYPTTTTRGTTSLCTSSSSSSSSSNAEPNPDPEPNPELIRQCKEYFAFRRTQRQNTQTTQTETNPNPTNPTTKTSGGSRGNFLLSSLSLSPPTLQSANYDDPYYDTLDVLDYAEMTRLGYDPLVRLVMSTPGGRFSVYRQCGLPVPPIPSELKPDRSVTPPLKIIKEGEIIEGMYTGLKLGTSLDSEELRLMSEDVGSPKKSFVPDKILPTPKNVPPKQTADWTAEMLDERGVEQGRVTSWARTQSEKRLGQNRANGGLYVGGKRVGDGNLAFLLLAPVGPSLGFGRSGGAEMVDLIGSDAAGALRVVGYVLTAAWVAGSVLGAKNNGVRGAIFGPADAKEVFEEETAL
ncbi:hypothetical protein TrST_g2108 [Triparma strigata]|uniref:Uncharacterized protein n=2 Tax=Triparma strigata TaxID=1606541 RepID=A0A9W7EMA7_9STRA|nr:hypothetical protein TrST_g2108 [Triparma strigata]